MPPRDPQAIQADFPVLVADLIDQLRLVGTVGLLNFVPTIQPTFIVGSRGLQVVSEEVAYNSAEIVSGRLDNPADGTVIADTGVLSAGIHDFKVYMSAAISAGGVCGLTPQWRNAANAANLADWHLACDTGFAVQETEEFSLNVAVNERLRILISGTSTGRFAATIFHKARPIP